VTVWAAGVVVTAATVVAGLMQLLLGVARAGIIALYFPAAVIRGMLAAIGIMIIVRQLPPLLGAPSMPSKSVLQALALLPDRDPVAVSDRHPVSAHRRQRLRLGFGPRTLGDHRRQARRDRFPAPRLHPELGAQRRRPLDDDALFQRPREFHHARSFAQESLIRRYGRHSAVTAAGGSPAPPSRVENRCAVSRKIPCRSGSGTPLGVSDIPARPLTRSRPSPLAALTRTQPSPRASMSIA